MGGLLGRERVDRVDPADGRRQATSSSPGPGSVATRAPVRHGVKAGRQPGCGSVSSSAHGQDVGLPWIQ